MRAALILVDTASLSCAALKSNSTPGAVPRTLDSVAAAHRFRHAGRRHCKRTLTYPGGTSWAAAAPAALRSHHARNLRGHRPIPAFARTNQAYGDSGGRLSSDPGNRQVS